MGHQINGRSLLAETKRRHVRRSNVRRGNCCDRFTTCRAARTANGFAKAWIDAAAANICKRRVDIVICWRRISLQQDRGRHDHAGNAISALGDIHRSESLLNRVTALPRQAFDSGDEPPLTSIDRYAAARHRGTVDVDRAGAAFARAAAIFGASQVGCIPKRPEQRGFRINQIFDWLVVDGELGQVVSRASLDRSCRRGGPSRRSRHGRARRGLASSRCRAGGRRPHRARS